MYGYVVVNQPEMKFKEYDIYRSYYCGLCSALKKDYGLKGQLCLSYDMTFLVMLLSGLYEPKTRYGTQRCVAHPIKKHQIRQNKISEYVADMNILMSYYKCMDDWKDERKLVKRIFAGSLSNRIRHIEKKYSKKSRHIKSCLERLSILEKNSETNIDKVSCVFGDLLSEIIVYKEDEWSNNLRRFGDYLGRFIYLMDAYDDLEKDTKERNYNVLSYHTDNKNFDDFCESILKNMMAHCAREFELLPIIENADILRNIIYSGVWTRFEIARRKRNDRSV